MFSGNSNDTKLYEELVGIQYGDIEDKFGWITILD